MLHHLADIDPSGKAVLIRADLNVPMADGRVTDDTRIRACAATILEVLERGGRPIVMSHLGRPKGQVRPEWSLAAVVEPLSAALDGIAVVLAGDCIGSAAHQTIDSAPNGVVLLENLRFHRGEETNDPEFADQLAELGDLYVNDAFSASHRAHASIVGVAQRLPAVAGRLLEREVGRLEDLLAEPRKPVMAMIGGAKIDDKLAATGQLCERFEVIAVGGGVANTFLKADGLALGRSLYDESMLASAREIRKRAAAHGCELLLPTDAVVAADLIPGSESRIADVAAVPGDSMIVDLGPRSIERIREHLDGVATVIWAGPLGAADKGFAEATHALGRAVTEATAAGRLRSVAGGGETLTALRDAGLTAGFSYCSLAGGAFLEWLKDRDLPGLKPLRAGPASILAGPPFGRDTGAAS